jgi:hypothetical protein
MSYYDRKCKYCNDYDANCKETCIYRQKPVPRGRVCVGCGTLCPNLKTYGKDCLGYKDGIDKSKQKKYLEKKYTDYDYKKSNC